MDIAGLVVSGVSALGTLIQAFYTAKSSNQKISKREITKAENRASKPLIIGAKQVGDVIDEELLLTLSREIEDHQKALVNAFSN